MVSFMLPYQGLGPEVELILWLKMDGKNVQEMHQQEYTHKILCFVKYLTPISYLIMS